MLTRLLFQLLSGLHVALYRLTGGRIGARVVNMDALLLITRGRRSGRERTIPLTYLPDGDSFVLIGSNGGRPFHPGWYHNLMASGEARVQLRDRMLRVRAEELPPEEASAFWATRVMAEAPQYDGYRRKTTRRIPLVRLTPV